jgi:hypothetical protein
VPAPEAPPAQSTPPASAPPAQVSVAVGHGSIFACKTASAEALKGSDCGTLPGLDGIVMPRLRKLARCPEAPEAATVSGKLHLVMHVDFPRNNLGVDLGRGNGGLSSSDALLACAKDAVSGASLAGVSHEMPRYSVAYTVVLGAGASTASSTGAARAVDDAHEEGSAQVVWEVAVVRDAPKTGKIVSRLQRGTTVRLGAMKDGWYPVKYGDSFASDGWLYRGAVGK